MIQYQVFYKECPYFYDSKDIFMVEFSHFYVHLFLINKSSLVFYNIPFKLIL